MAAKPDDLDLKLALCTGFGLTVEAAAELCSVTPGTYYNRSRDKAEFYGKWRSFAELLRNKALAAEIAKLKSGQKAEERITDRLDRALAITDRAIAKLESLGDKATLKELIEGHKALTTWIADFAASKAPKRLKMEGKVTHEHRVISEETVTRLTAFMEKNQALLPPADAIEAEVAQ